MSSLCEQNNYAWDQLYKSTDELVWGKQPVGFIAPFLSLLQRHLYPGAFFLDAAVGEGRNLNTIKSLNMTVWACDISSTALKKIPPAPRHNTILIQCDLLKMPFLNNSFDGVLASDIIETLPIPTLAIKELYRILKPGGILLCNIPDMDDSIATQEMAPLQVTAHQYLYQHAYFFQFMSVIEATTLLTTQGFRVLHQQCCHWQEESHPNFRAQHHQHTSQVFLAQK